MPTEDYEYEAALKDAGQLEEKLNRGREKWSQALSRIHSSPKSIIPDEIVADLRLFSGSNPQDLDQAIQLEQLASYFINEARDSDHEEEWFQIVKRLLIQGLSPFRGLPGHYNQSFLSIKKGTFSPSLTHDLTAATIRTKLALEIYARWNRTGLFYKELDWLQLAAGQLLLNDLVLNKSKESGMAIHSDGRGQKKVPEYLVDLRRYFTYSLIRAIGNHSRESAIYLTAFTEKDFVHSDETESHYKAVEASLPKASKHLESCAEQWGEDCESLLLFGFLIGVPMEGIKRALNESSP